MKTSCTFAIISQWILGMRTVSDRRCTERNRQFTCNRNIEERSCNYYCNRKAIRVTYSECVCL